MIQTLKDLITDLFELQNTIGIATSKTGVRQYDFDFRHFFESRSVFGKSTLSIVLRIGAIRDYDQLYQAFSNNGMTLINSVEEHNRASMLPEWYPLISDLTPRSNWYTTPPSVNELRRNFDWPVFIKGERQTNRHKRSLSIAKNESDYQHILAAWDQDPILNWQRIICREYIPLEHIADPEDDSLPASVEFRVFVWRGTAVSIGQYWQHVRQISLDQQNKEMVLALAEEAARRTHVPFLVVDIARTVDRKWIVIELNDAQESGYAGNAAIALWETIIRLERKQ